MVNSYCKPVSVSNDLCEFSILLSAKTDMASEVMITRLFYESALIDPENAFRNITKTHFET